MGKLLEVVSKLSLVPSSPRASAGRFTLDRWDGLDGYSNRPGDELSCWMQLSGKSLRT
jgi:hypothetical protein